MAPSVRSFKDLNRFVLALECCVTLDQAIDALYVLFKSLGFDGIVYGSSASPRHYDGSWKSLPLMTRNLPCGWEKDWPAHSPHDPILHKSYDRPEVEWSEVCAQRNNLTSDERASLEYIMDAGLRYGLTMSCRGATRWAGVTAIGDEKKARIWNDLISDGRIIVKISLLYLNNWVESRFSGGLISVKLSDREKECLYWSAKGKTVDEIGIIIGISTETVKSYIKRLNGKLGATNRVQAVAKAVSFGILNVAD